jgi:hypothetical protein
MFKPCAVSNTASDISLHAGAISDSKVIKSTLRPLSTSKTAPKTKRRCTNENQRNKENCQSA